MSFVVIWCYVTNILKLWLKQHIFCSWICNLDKPLPLPFLMAAGTAGRLESNEGLCSHKSGDRLAVVGVFGWDCWAECLNVTSPCGLTCPMTHDTETDFKDKHLKRELERNCGPFLTELHSHEVSMVPSSILWKKVTAHIPGERKQSPSF